MHAFKLSPANRPFVRPGAVVATSATDNNAQTDMRDSNAILSSFVNAPGLTRGNAASALDVAAATMTKTIGAPGDNNHSLDSGFFQPPSLGDRVWFDDNHNGNQDPGETDVPNVLVTLHTPTGDLTRTTSITGFYIFTDLLPLVNYTLTFVLPPGGYVFTLQNSGATSSTDSNPNALGTTPPISLTAAEHNPTIDAGIWRAEPEIVVKKYTNGFDADLITGPFVPVGSTVTWTYVITNSGNQTLTQVTLNDDKLPGTVTACLPQAGLSALTPGAAITCTATGIAVAGQYTNLATVTGTYDIEQGRVVTDEDPSHYFGDLPKIKITKYTNGEDADLPTGPKVVAGSTVTWTYRVTNTGNVPLRDFDLIDDKIGQINPVNCSPSPLPVFAVGAVTLCTATGIAILGQYENDSVVTAVYTPTQPPGPDLPNSPPPFTSSIPVSDSNPSHYYSLPSSLGDRVWLDANRDGQQGSPGAEPGIANIAVTLHTPTGTLTTTTSITGYYIFAGLLPNVPYSVSFAVPPTYFVTSRYSGSVSLDSDIDAQGGTGSVVLAPEEHNPTIDAGLYVLGRLGDYVWYDGNQNGRQDVSEIGVANITVTLYTCSGAQLAVTRTNSSGLYLFDGLLPGDYYVIFSNLPGYSFTVPLVGNPAGDSDANVMTGRSGCVTISNDKLIDLTLDAGIYKPEGPGSAVTLAGFSARQTAGGTRIRWRTTSELDTAGFYLMRDTGAQRQATIPVSAVRVATVAAFGANGADYSIMDTGTSHSERYTYWLIEVTSQGENILYGPATTGSTVYLPVLTSCWMILRCLHHRWRDCSRAGAG